MTGRYIMANSLPMHTIKRVIGGEEQDFSLEDVYNKL
jgi:hypothetical protein